MGSQMELGATRVAWENLPLDPFGAKVLIFECQKLLQSTLGAPNGPPMPRNPPKPKQNAHKQFLRTSISESLGHLNNKRPQRGRLKKLKT